MAKKKILCVEDHSDMCELVGLILEGYEVIGEHSVAGALRRASSEAFDLFLLDYHLPDGTGIELCLFIRSFDSQTPILFITGTSSMTNSQALTIGSQGLVSKNDNLVIKLKAVVDELLA